MAIEEADLKADAQPPRASATEELLHSVLQALVDGRMRDVRTVAEIVADSLGLEEATRALKIPRACHKSSAGSLGHDARTTILSIMWFAFGFAAEHANAEHRAPSA